jgi:hypothetical protein
MGSVLPAGADRPASHLRVVVRWNKPWRDRTGSRAAGVSMVLTAYGVNCVWQLGGERDDIGWVEGAGLTTSHPFRRHGQPLRASSKVRTTRRSGWR